MDVHVPQAITDQLRRRSVSVLTAIENDSDKLLDDELLEHVRSLGRVFFTQDIRFKIMAEDRQRQGKTFSGLVFGQHSKLDYSQILKCYTAQCDKESPSD
jgi:hypothetical protein